ncbi:MAG: NADH-quinone oxidoreductase subunit L [Chloroflexaceae bacterium]|nr:NADH-quinone oxidoreductase subunit L [Chloroflexaceae bacterium]
MALFLQAAWLIPIFPLLSFLLILLTPLRRNRQASGGLAIALMALAAVLASGLLLTVAQGFHLSADGHIEVHALAAEHGEGATGAFAFPDANVVQRVDWAPTGSTTLQAGIYIDGLAAVLLAMVAITSTCIHLFSLGYMAHHSRQSDFFAYISLFTSAMLLMTMADNLLLFFMAWEVMGLCSYLLIGFLFERPTAYRAAVKAFITTRIGDVLMMIGLVYLYVQTGTLAFGNGTDEIFNAALLEGLATSTNVLGMSHATAIALLLFAGTVGKSAQFPLHVWLPDAMEGPTPVSALIHAATMVAAGVFLVARTYPIFTADDGTALGVVTFIGAFTALFAASIAMTQFDIKRILAYSTLSQLGFMVAALGLGGFVAGFFHLITHAFFKALLFLGSGSVIHAMEHTPAIEEIHHHDEYAAQQTAQDIRNMGGLREVMPWTFRTYIIGALALAGIVPLAGFWSKDEILADALKYNVVVYGVLTLASFLTAFYMTRQCWLVFFGTYRGDHPRPAPYVRMPTGKPPIDQQVAVEQEEEGMAAPPHESISHGDRATHPHESPQTMVIPLLILAFFAVVVGALNLPGSHWLATLLGQEAVTFNVVVAVLSTVTALAGIAAGWALYRNTYPTAQATDPLEEGQPGLFGLLNNAYGFDTLYRRTVGLLTDLLAAVWSWFDQQVLARIVAGVGALTLFLGRLNFIADDTFFNDGPDALAKGTVTTGDGVRHSQTGKVQDYIGLVFGGVVILALVYLYVVG